MAAGSAAPEFGYTADDFTYEDVAPYDFAAIYNLLPLWNANIDGTGQTIAIAGTSDINIADVATFRSAFGLPAGTPPQTIVANGTDPGECLGSGPGLPCTFDDLVENTLDVEWSGAVAKGASIVLVVSGSNSTTTDTVYSSADYVVQNVTANILSVSYGECELGEGTSGNAAYNNLWETAASEGIAVFVAAGDAGSATCDQDLATSTPYSANYGLSVSGLASTPFDTAVGGTDLNWGSTPSPYWGATDNAGNDSDALGYIPEVPWNDTCTNPLALNYLQEWAAALIKAGFSAASPYDAETACNFVNQWWNTIYTHTDPAANISGFLNVIGGGGGASNCTTSNGTTVASCAGGYAKPSWQSGVPGIPADGARDLPDVSFFAGNGFLGTSYLICESFEAACSYTSSSEPLGEEVGGTSVGTPAMAGVMALIDQKAGVPQGNPNAELYALAGQQSYGNCSAETGSTSDGCAFNDLDTGTIAMPCTAGSPNCTVTHTGDVIGILSGYSATTGFDAATGLGSLNIANVVNAWTSTIGTASATVTVTPATNSFAASQSVAVSVTVSGASGTPTGNIALTGGGGIASGTLSGGTATITMPAYSLSAGSDTLTARYSGNATYARATGTASVTVAKATPTVTVQPSVTLIGGVAYETAEVTVSGGGPTPTGSVTVTANSNVTPACYLYSGSCSITINSDYLVTGTNTITANYSGDNEYNPAAGTNTITILAPTLQVIPATTNFTAAQSVQVTLNVTGTGPTPTGNVNLSSLAGLNINGVLSNGSYTFTIPPATLSPGTDTLQANYFGDNTYRQASTTFPVTVTIAPSSVTVTPAGATLYSNDSLLLYGQIIVGGGTPTGNLTISSGAFTETAYISGTPVPGQYSALVPAGSLSPGTDTITVAYGGSTYYSPSSATTSVTVTQWVKIAPTLTVTPTSNAVGLNAPLDVSIGVTGTDGQPTGTVTLTTGSYSSGAWAYPGGSFDIIVPANTLSSLGTATLNVSYSGDATYLPATASANIPVVNPTFTLSAGSAPSIAPGGSTATTITATTTTDYTGVLTASCALTAEPSGANYLPICTMQGTATAIIQTGVQNAYFYAGVTTTAATANLVQPALPGSYRKWNDAGGIAFGLVVLLGVPARRRRWRAFFGVLVLLAVFGGLSACGGGGGGVGGGGGGGGGGGVQTGGTTAGTYTFTVTATGNPAVTPQPATTFTVTVN